MLVVLSTFSAGWLPCLQLTLLCVDWLPSILLLLLQPFRLHLFDMLASWMFCPLHLLLIGCLLSLDCLAYFDLDCFYCLDCSASVHILLLPLFGIVPSAVMSRVSNAALAVVPCLVTSRPLHIFIFLLNLSLVDIEL